MDVLTGLYPQISPRFIISHHLEWKGLWKNIAAVHVHQPLRAPGLQYQLAQGRQVQVVHSPDGPVLTGIGDYLFKKDSLGFVRKPHHKNKHF